MILTTEEQEAVDDLQDIVAEFNEVLAECHKLNLEVNFQQHSERFVGKVTPLLIVEARCRSTLIPGPFNSKPNEPCPYCKPHKKHPAGRCDGLGRGGCPCTAGPRVAP